MAMVTITGFGVQSGTSRTMYATWNWSQEHTKGYNVRWYYDTGDTNGSGTVWFIGDDSEVSNKQSTYSAPSNAIRVRFVVKPVSETYKQNDNDVAWFTADWSTEKIYNFSSNIPAVPSAPSVTIKNYTLTATLDDVDTNTSIVQFQVVKDNTTIFSTGQADVEKDFKYVSYSCYVDAGSTYKVRCRGCRDSLYSEWSEFSSDANVIPATPAGFTDCRAKTSTSVYLAWEAVNAAESYNIEYSTNKDYFDSSDNTTTISGIETTRYEKTGLENGDTYYFRLQAVNGSGKSPWSEISSVVVGKKPAAPTTWSSTTTVITGEPLVLYWVHNSEDGSSQTYAELEIILGDVSIMSRVIQNTSDDDEKDKTSSYTIDTSKYGEGMRLKWHVRTKGVTDEYSDWSVFRTVDIYAPPTLSLSMTDSGGNPITTLTSLPIKIRGKAGPTTQRAIGYHLSVIASHWHETVDILGNDKIINKGDVLYSRYFNNNSNELSITLSASDLHLENNARYKVICVASMNSGLTVESTLEFNVAWSDSTHDINCSISIDTNRYVACISPYCTDSTGTFPKDITLAVYRREFDGKFTEIASGIEGYVGNEMATRIFVTDPHPALDYARYRIVAMSTTTGQVEYYDVPAYPVGGKAAIIQWDEAWSDFDATIDDTLASPDIWSGTMLKLPYNIDITDSNNRDVVLVEYIGREHPISYHGTQLGMKSTWNVDIPASDKETIYALRRLQNWMGNVYVREPSGTGYWANVAVSFSKKHCEVTIPVTINVTRVEGGK